MYCLNHRIGILFRENLAKKSYQIRYFFIDDSANLYYIANLPRLQKVIRQSRNPQQIKRKLIKIGEKSFNISKYNISQPKLYVSEAVLPFSNRTCIEMKEKESKTDDKTYQVFGFIDEDTQLLHDQIVYLTGKKKVEFQKRKSVIEEQKQKQKKVASFFFEDFVGCQDKFKMSSDELDDNHYEGEKVEGLPDGKGKQILISKGITYSGFFSQGKKQGPGYLVNANLDTLECDFIEDELAGI